MILNYDIFNRLEKPAIILCNPNRVELFSLSDCYKPKLMLKYNALSELDFDYYRSNDNGKTILPAYDYLKNKRLVLIENFGYFQITSVEEDLDGSIPCKKVVAMSLETELVNKQITMTGNEYQFYNVFDPTNTSTLMGYVLSLIPSWSVGTIDPNLALLYRGGFTTQETTIYSFLVNDVEKAYGCVFSFDTVNKTISAQLIASATTPTDIYFSFDNILKKGTFKEVSEEQTTALKCFGGDPLTIRSVNPLGTDYIYNYDYYKTTDWMSQGLIDALNIWEAKVASVQVDYANTLTLLKSENDRLLALTNGLHHTPPQRGDITGLVEYQSQYTNAENLIKARIEQGGLDIAVYTAELNGIALNIQNAQANIAASQALIDSYTATLQNYNASLSIWENNNNFTPAQQIELSELTFENTYQNKNIIITDSSTPSEIQAQSQALYDQSKDVLSRVAFPRYEFTVDAVNFLALKEYYQFTSAINVGSTITVDMGLDVPIVSVVLEIDISLDDPKDFSLTFSNRLRLDNAAFRYSDLMDQIQKSSSATNFNSQAWSDWNANYKNDVSTFISSALNTAKNTLINSNDQEIVINQNGLRGRHVTNPGGSPLVYDPTQLWLTSSLLAFTGDAWNTANLALGKITAPNGQPAFGLVADSLVGKMIAGNSLIINSATGLPNGASFSFDSRGATMNNASLTISNSNSTINLNPSVGIKVFTNIGGNVSQKLYIDTNGNLTMTGKLVAATGDFSGQVTASSGLLGGIAVGQIPNSSFPGLYLANDPSNYYISSNGNLKWGQLSVIGGVFTFNGKIQANQIEGQIINTQIGDGAVSSGKISSVDAGSVKSGTMSGSFISGGIINGAGGFQIMLTGASVPTITASAALQLTGGSGGVYMSSDHVRIGPGSGTSLTVNGSGTSFNGKITANDGISTSYIDTNGSASIGSGLTVSGTTRLGSYLYIAGRQGVSVGYTVSTPYGSKNLYFTNGILTGYDA